MKELLVARQALIKDRTAALNRQKVVRSPLLRRQIEQRLRQIARQLAALMHSFKACAWRMRLWPHAWRSS
jgi:hypothetical protein